MALKKRKLFRIIIPKFPFFNIYTNLTKITTSAGPLFVATSAARLDCWDAEVIDENNLHGRYYPRTENGELDHAKLQIESPADIVGFYGSISSSIPRLYELAQFYRLMGAVTIAGGKHIENVPLEALNNNLDYVFFGEADISIRKFLQNFDNPPLRNRVEGIGFLDGKVLVKTEDQKETEILDRLPVPDYHLLKYAKMKIYPIASTRGCNMNCEFCAVKGHSRSCSPEKLLKTIKYLVENYKAKSFFDVSDHFASNMDNAIRFLELFARYQDEIGKRLSLTIQTRLTDARSRAYLEAIKKARVDTLCIGFESPVEADLKEMNKGYRSDDMLKLTRLYKNMGARIHGMFIFAYPGKSESGTSCTLESYIESFWDFIRKSKIDTLQLLMAIPLPGTELRERLKKNNRLFPLKYIGWQYYDGQYPLYHNESSFSPEKIQKAVGLIMKRFYKRAFLARCIKNIAIDFPLILFPSTMTILSGRITYIKKAFRFWYRKFFSNNALCFGGSLILKNWFRNYRKGDFHEKLEMAEKSLIKQR